jgi:hypothetical protein
MHNTVIMHKEFLIYLQFTFKKLEYKKLNQYLSKHKEILFIIYNYVFRPIPNHHQG